MSKQLTPEEVANHLLSDINSYKDNILKMLVTHLTSNETDQIYWDAWFRGATGKALVDADNGMKYPETIC